MGGTLLSLPSGSSFGRVGVSLSRMLLPLTLKDDAGPMKRHTRSWHKGSKKQKAKMPLMLKDE